MSKHLDKIIYILVLLVCCYFGYQTRIASVVAQNNYISEFEKNLEIEKEEGKPFSVSLKTIGVLYVPDIKLTLAVFNNAGEAAISHGCGLIQGTGTLENNHDNSVVTSHNGDPSSDLFINLPKIKVGNKFYIKMKDGKIYE